MNTILKLLTIIGAITSIIGLILVFVAVAEILIERIVRHFLYWDSLTSYILNRKKYKKWLDDEKRREEEKKIQIIQELRSGAPHDYERDTVLKSYSNVVASEDQARSQEG